MYTTLATLVVYTDQDKQDDPLVRKIRSHFVTRWIYDRKNYVVALVVNIFTQHNIEYCIIQIAESLTTGIEIFK